MSDAWFTNTVDQIAAGVDGAVPSCVDQSGIACQFRGARSSGGDDCVWKTPALLLRSGR
jgi:hypothetical protein